MPPSANVNVTRSVTVPRDAQRPAAQVLTDCLITIVSDFPDLVSGNVSIFGDDFAEQDTQAKSAESGETVVRLPDTPEEETRIVDNLVRQALDRAGYAHVGDSGKLL